ncbi:MAG: glycoside hydrolase family 88 protein [Spirochaetales bacterium]|nr:glycoside hydrolase family 88 protein [Spirochaetales bacterium]
MTKEFKLLLELADATTKRLAYDSIPWMWGEALLMHSLGLINEHLGEDRYTDYIRSYADHHIKKGCRIDQSDTLAPTLATYYLQKKFPDGGYEITTDRGLEYIRNSEKILHNMPNHLGHSLEGKLYPKSIWVDSIMMYGVFTSLYAKEQGVQWLMDFAKSQPSFFRRYLQDEENKLFVHCYWTKSGRKYPEKLYWGRGNGWVIGAMPMLIGNLPDGPEKEECKDIVREVSKALRPLQREDGYFETLLNKPGTTLKESSATALIASGWMRAVREGYLDISYLDPAIRAYRAVLCDLEKRDGMLSMDHISGPTIAMPLIPKLGYKLQYKMQRSNDWSYGLAALFFAGMEFEKTVFGGDSRHEVILEKLNKEGRQC